MKQQLTRSSDKLIAGVCSGVARSFGVDATLVRIVWAVASCFFLLPVVVYAVLWLVLPIDGGGTGIDDLVAALDDLVPRSEVCVEVLVPFAEGRLVARMHDLGEIETEEHTEHGTRLRARVPHRLAGELARFAVSQA